jgi:acetylglutamate kinase
MIVDRLPPGFLASGRNAGIKNSKSDCGVLIADGPAVMAACVTQNRSRAPCTARVEAIRDRGGPVRAILAVSGNANALTGEAGREADRALAAALADRLGVAEDEVLTAFTGIIGHRPPFERIEAAIDLNLESLDKDPTRFAESVLTTDRVIKMAARECFIEGTRVRLHGVAKGSGMVAPSLATMLAFITTDAEISRESLQACLREAVERTFNQLTVDGEMSTNDAVVALASGFAENARITGGDNEEIFRDALIDLCEELAIEIAKDGEGATRLLTVRVNGARSEHDARRLARGVAGSLLVKAAVFGADPNAGGRMVASAGGAAARFDIPYQLERVSLAIQGERVVEGGVRVHNAKLRHRMMEPEVLAELDLGLGSGTGVAWGCDLSYDYVKINADYAAITKATEEGTVAVEERLTGLGPSIKKKILIEALRYIDEFRGLCAVVNVSGAAMNDPKLEEQLAEDVLLLRSCGLRPIVVHGANQRLVAVLNREGSRAVGLSGNDGGLIRANERAIASVDPRLIDMLEKDGYVPVITPQELESDVVAAALANAIGAEKLIYLSDVPGILEDDGLLTELTSDQAKLRIERGEITGSVRRTVEAALTALAGGVDWVHLVDGRVPHNLIAELFTDRGVGTLIRRA